MEYPLWEIQKRESPNYVLSTTQREYINNPNTEHKNKEKDISKKRDKLPARFQDLIDDVVLLEAGGYLDKPDCADCGPPEWSATEWEDLTDIEPRARSLEEYSEYPPSIAKLDSSEHSVAGFSQELGYLLNILHDHPHYQWYNLVLGFATGLLENRIDDLSQEEFERIWTKVGRRLLVTIELDPEDLSLTLKEAEDRKQTRDFIITILREEGIKPTVPLMDYFVSEHDPLTTDPITNLNEAKQIINELEHPIPLIEIEAIRLMLKKEVQKLRSESNGNYRGLTWDEVLQVLWDEDLERDEPSSSTIASHINSSSSVQGTVTGVCNRMGGEPTYDQYTTHQAVRGDNAGWELTACGKLLAHHVFEEGSDSEWVHEVVGEQTDRTVLIEEAASELPINQLISEYDLGS